MTYKKSSKSSVFFVCECCKYKTVRKSQYDRHLFTAKHKILTNTSDKVPKSSEYICECGKIYKHRQSLNNHKKRCNIIENEILREPESINYKELLMNVIKEMKEQREEFIEEVKKKDEIIAHKDKLMAKIIDKVGNTTNNTNNSVNINMFLNEKCKDAINFSDFIERIEVTRDDLENNAQLGFVNGITKILMDNLKQLTIYQRPIHCTDVKRETMYIKDKDTWDKKDSDKKLENAIQEVSRKSIGSLLDWKQNNPDYEDLDSDFSKKCISIQMQSIASSNRSIYYPRIIHNLARENSIKNVHTETSRN